MNELVEYYPSNPDPVSDGCLNSGIIEEGVVFRHIEPERGFQCFVGVTSLLAAVAEVYGLTPNQVKDRLTREKKMVDNMREKLADAEKERDDFANVILSLRDVLTAHADILPEG